MRWILCLSMLGVLGFAPAPIYKPKPSETDLEKLQGTWQPGPLRKAGAGPKRIESWTFNGSGVTIFAQDGPTPVTSAWKVIVDSSSRPKTLQLSQGTIVRSASYELLAGNRLMLYMVSAKEEGDEGWLVREGGGRLLVLTRHKSS